MRLNKYLDIVVSESSKARITSAQAVFILEQYILKADFLKNADVDLKRIADHSDLCVLGDVRALLVRLNDAYNKVGKKEAKKTIARVIRLACLIAAPERVASMQYEKKADKHTPTEFNDLLEKLSHKYGTIPTKILPRISLPREEYLPKNFRTSVVQWAKKPLHAPKRKENVNFLTRDGSASVRLQLKAEPKPAEIPKDEALCTITADYYPASEMHADHMVPSGNILRRQKEMVMAMNLDNEYAKLMKRECARLAGLRDLPDVLREVVAASKSGQLDSDVGNHLDPMGFFVQIGDEVVGSAWWYAMGHNCFENVSFMRGKYGLEKSDKDPEEWFRTLLNFGDEFLGHLRERVGVRPGESPLDRSYVVPMLKNGEFLADVTRAWCKTRYREKIAQAPIMSCIARRLNEAALGFPEDTRTVLSKDQQRRAAGRLAVLTFPNVIEHMSSSAPSSSTSDSGSTGSGHVQARMLEVARRPLMREAMILYGVRNAYKRALKEVIRTSPSKDAEVMTAMRKHRRGQRSIGRERFSPTVSWGGSAAVSGGRYAVSSHAQRRRSSSLPRHIPGVKRGKFSGFHPGVAPVRGRSVSVPRQRAGPFSGQQRSRSLPRSTSMTRALQRLGHMSPPRIVATPSSPRRRSRPQEPGPRYTSPTKASLAKSADRGITPKTGKPERQWLGVRHRGRRPPAQPSKPTHMELRSGRSSRRATGHG